MLITFANNLDPDQARQKSGLIWIQTTWHSDGIPESIFQILISVDDKKAACKKVNVSFFRL